MDGQGQINFKSIYLYFIYSQFQIMGVMLCHIKSVTLQTFLATY